ncbi:flagellar hook-length control protein FliK [Pantoea sp.]|uniref:flagellar hook-length control protein FliK n=1 Tax=Pantoea sp. TaxID=69393 RepID=UPI0031DB1D28
MNIDIATLLAGSAESLPKLGKLSDKNFGLTLDEKLGDLEQLLLVLHSEVLPAIAEGTPEAAPLVLTPSASELPVELELAGEVALSDDSEMDEKDLPSVLLEVLADDNPQWQLQQWVTQLSSNADIAPVITEAKGPMINPLLASVNLKPTAPVIAEAPLVLSRGTEKTSSAPAAVFTPAMAMEPVMAVETPSAQPVAAPMPITLRPVANTQAMSVATVTYPPETPQWKQSVSQHIAVFSRNGMHNAEIRLHPEELGSLHITLRVHQDQAQVHIVSEHALVRQAMEHAMPQLRTAMAEAGLQLGQASVGADNNPYADANAQGEQDADGQQEASQPEELGPEDDIVPTLLTTTPGNIYGINTFA